MIFTIPESLEAEHQILHDELKCIMQSGGAIGDAAKAVAKPLHKHFVAEEEYALLPLGLLSPLAAGTETVDMLPVLRFTDTLKERVSVMVREHQQIVMALDKLSEVAQREQRRDIVQFARRLKLHAQLEEEVLYPAAILVGEFLRLRLDKAVGLPVPALQP